MVRHTGEGARAGERFGPFEILDRLGAGGMAVVHRALRHRAGAGPQEVALKRLLPHLADDATFIRAFAREASMARRLDHENICRIHELGRVRDAYFISMECLDGHDLRVLLRRAHRSRQVPPVEVTLSILSQLCAALDHAHCAVDEETGEPLGLVHRDVSPANILVTSSGLVKVIDFGIARATLDRYRTETGRFRGKLGYLSPEAIQGQALDGRSDLFSLGVIAHELLTARPLFGAVNDFDTLSRVQFGQIDPPSRLNHQCPPALDALVATALARDPGERFHSAAAMLDALLAVGPGSREAVAGWIREGAAAEDEERQAGTEDLVVELVWGKDEEPAGAAAVPEIADVAAAAVVVPLPPLLPLEDGEVEPEVRRQESLELEALQQAEVTRNERPELEVRDTVLMEQLARPTDEQAASGGDGGATIKTDRLMRDPADFETVEIERLEQVTAACQTVKVEPLGRRQSEASAPSSHRGLAWRPETTLLLGGALLLLALAVLARAL
jgi:hypothetical protein